MKVTARARSRDDRAGDPLDGLVNLFDLGIVLSVAFLLAALSSLDLTSALTSKSEADQATRPANAVVAKKDQQVKEIQLKPGERIVGRGRPVGTVYRLSDGRTVIVKGEGGSPLDGRILKVAASSVATCPARGLPPLPKLRLRPAAASARSPFPASAARPRSA